MRRRDFLLVLGGAAVWPLIARGDAGRLVLGWLSTGSPDAFASRLAALREGIGEHGFREGRNLAIEYRWANGQYGHMQALAAELVASKVDVILASGPPALRAAAMATSSIPVVFVTGSDPVRDGVVSSMSRPDRNLTGITFLAVDLTPKRLELVGELVPQAKLAYLLTNPSNRAEARVIADAQNAAESAGFEIATLKATNEAEIDAGFATVAGGRAGVLIVSPDTLFTTRAEKIAALAVRHHIPTIFAFRESVLAGGLASYGPSISRVYREAGAYVGRILKGDKPGDLPILQPQTFEFTINLRTAKAVGLTVSPALLARADEVIE